MADNNELLTSRLTDASSGATIDNAFADLEAALRTIFGIPADTVMSEAMQIVAGGNATMTGTATLAGAPTTDLMAATRQYVQGGISGFGTTRCRVGMTSDDVILSSGDHYYSWDAATIESGGDIWSSGNPTRLTIPSAGHYLVGACIQNNKEPEMGDIRLSVSRTTDYLTVSFPGGPKSNNYQGISFSQLFYFQAGWYLELVQQWPIGSGPEIIEKESCFWLMKVSE